MKSSYIPVIDLGKQPRHANGFLNPDQFGSEEFFEMVIGYDPTTNAIRLMEPCERGLMFNDQYAFYSKTSQSMIEHFARTATQLQVYVPAGGLVVEVGSNDGVMLDAWKALGVKAIGIDPSKNVNDIARAAGHEVIDDFVSDASVTAIIRKYQKANLVYGANVSCHITALDEYFDLVARLLGEDGVFVFEDPYFLDVYKRCSYDQFYGEHTWMFTLKFLQPKLEEHGLQIFNIEHLQVHGGSMRYFVGKRGTRNISPMIGQQIGREGNLHRKLSELALRIKESREELINILEAVRGKRVCGFGATSKGVVVTNYCGIGRDLVPFITDTTPTKIGKYYPGSHIPIVQQDATDYSQLDYIVNFAWNHFDEIRKNRTDFHGKWITHVPHPRIVR